VARSDAHIQIRPATPGDAGDIARLTTLLGYPSTTDDITSRLDVLLQSASYFIAIAEQSSHVVGWVAAERRVLLESGERAEIVGLVVEMEARRTGVGRALVQAAEVWASTQHLDLISVRSNVARVESHPFYENLGYERRKTQHAYVKKLRDSR
jgi:predicted N-acetyltransferase YhbS